MAKYVVLIYGDESHLADMNPETWAAMMDAHNAFGRAVAEMGGTILGGDALAPASSATSIRDGLSVTDGPFVETKETLGGFYVIEARDLDHILAIAAKCPAPTGGVEVRPIVDTSGS